MKQKDRKERGMRRKDGENVRIEEKKQHLSSFAAPGTPVLMAAWPCAPAREAADLPASTAVPLCKPLSLVRTELSLSHWSEQK
jgi:hypothetical protein